MRRTTTLTRKGQVTIPKTMRDESGLRARDRIAFSIENGAAKMRRARFSLDEMSGMLPPIGIPVEEMSAVAWEEWVEKFAEENQ